MKLTTAVKKKINSRVFSFPLWAGLLIISGLAPPFVLSEQHTDTLSVQIDAGLVTVAARDVPVGNVIKEIAAQSDLRLVLHADLDRPITVDVAGATLPEVLAIVLEGGSYQLYHSGPASDDADYDPGTLWIFSEGEAQAPTATLFLEAVFYHGSPREKIEAIRELRRLGTPAAVNSLSLALGDENTNVRHRALEALERIGGDEAMAAIASAAMDSDPWVRSEAASALASGDSETATQYLTMALDDSDPDVRVSAVEALANVPFGTVPSPQAVAALNRALQDENPDVRMQAMRLLEDIGGDIAFQALMRARLDEDPDIAEAATESLSSFD